MNFRRALALLQARQESRMELGLGRMRACLKRLGDPHLKVPAIHVAGTNGKGSTCAILDSVLRKAGLKTGLYTSPHLCSVRERIRVDGRPIAEADLGRLMGEVAAADPKGGMFFFELLTAAAFLHFAEEGVEAAVLETGLGGRLDATNVVESPLVSVITSIARDHVEHLGGSLASIAGEKAGIIKKGAPVVCPDLPAPALRAIRAKAARIGAPLVVVKRVPRVASVDWRAGIQRLEAPGGKSWDLSLLGSRQARNAAVARAALAQLPERFAAGESAWAAGLASVRWPCRFDVRRRRGAAVIIDGAHNVEAMEQFAKTLDASPWGRGRVGFVIGVLREKDAGGMLRVLAPRLRDVAVCAPPSPRALDPLRLAAAVRLAAPRARVTVEHDPAAAIRALLGRRLRAVAVCGSLYLAGKASRALSAAGSGVPEPRPAPQPRRRAKGRGGRRG